MVEYSTVTLSALIWLNPSTIMIVYGSVNLPCIIEYSTVPLSALIWLNMVLLLCALIWLTMVLLLSALI